MLSEAELIEIEHHVAELRRNAPKVHVSSPDLFTGECHCFACIAERVACDVEFLIESARRGKPKTLTAGGPGGS